MKKYTPKEDQFILDNCLTIPMKRISKLLNRSESSARQRASLLGVVIPKEVIEKFRKESQFKKGAVPVNKGKKQTEWLTKEGLKKVRSSQFKKGNLPHNTKHDGLIQIRYDYKDRGGRPYKYIRIAMANWKPLHIHLWEQEYGKVKRGHIVVFKDKDTMNCELSNLEMITRKENMSRNTFHRYPRELKFTIIKLNQLKKTINGKK